MCNMLPSTITIDNVIWTIIESMEVEVVEVCGDVMRGTSVKQPWW